MCSKVKNENYVVIPGWALTDLKLKGNDLLVYCIIYGFSQNGDYFRGSIEYLSEWTNSTVQGVRKNIHNLIDRGLISVAEGDVVNYYKAVIPGKGNSVSNSDNSVSSNSVTDEGNLVTEEGNSVTQDSKLSCPNNIDSNIDNHSNNSSVDPELSKNIKLVVDYLNMTCHTNFKLSTEDTRKFIKARFNQGFSLQDFYKVIEYKYQTWGVEPYTFKNGKLSSVYLRPSTLFGNKFETYLYEANSLINELNKQKEKKNSKIDFDNLEVLAEY